MDLMACNDLDIDIENSAMSLERLYQLTEYILRTFKPVWYEAKEELNDEGKTVWFHGFETVLLGQLWNFDLWFFDENTINKAEAFCDSIERKANEISNAKNSIITIKSKLIDKGLYSFEQYTSMDVYKAVLEQGIMNIDSFMQIYHK